MIRKLAPSFFALSIAFALAGCPGEPTERPDVACSDVCKKRILGCSPHECERGCAFVIDRLVEHQQEPVLHCMEMSQGCADKQWADCAVHIGVHADGGPDVPSPLPSEL
jgi:hypothetical protein